MTEHGLPFAADLHAPLHPHYYPGGIFVKPDTGSEWRMACLLGDRVDHCRCGMADLQKENILGKIKKAWHRLSRLKGRLVPGLFYALFKQLLFLC